MDALLDVRPVAWIVRAFPTFMTVVGLISLVGLAADLQAWRELLGGIDSAVFPVAISSAILLVGLVLLSHQIRTPRPRANISPRPDSEGSADRRIPASSPSQSRPTTGRPAGGEKTRETFGDLLQRQLDKGRALQRNLPPFPGMIRPAQPTTTEADVDVWINRTRRLLRSRPGLLADFNYKPAESPLHRLLQPRTFEPQYKERLDLHIANLTELITGLRQEEQ